MNEEELTELLPIVAELTRKYTSGESTCQKLLKDLIQHFYGDNLNMYEYLAHDLSEFAVLLKNVKDTNYIKNVVIL